MCALAAASPGRERPVCLGAADLMTPLTALIHTQVLVHIWEREKNTQHQRGSNQQRIGCVSWVGGGHV